MTTQKNTITIENHYDIEILLDMTRDYLRNPMKLTKDEIQYIHDFQSSLCEMYKCDID